MEGRFVDPNARLLISGLLVEPPVCEYMKRLKDERVDVFNHCINVAYLTAEIVLSKNFVQLDTNHSVSIRDITIGALLHDVGKLCVPNEILLKPGKLTDEEYAICKKHVEFGYEMIKDRVDVSDTVKQIILNHHEKNDGTGYPNGKHDGQISLETQIVSVCDIYDALTEPRSYREGNDLRSALDILTREPINLAIFLSLVSCRDK